ncbi:CLUMA_CG011552, isoform A [Clunio marinus]|uniref:alkaline phosphatase n=1 Tax=Clunio marinus TaxID=568069 RepID=A0A1J1ID93_9DIPT|nr:CLUMA_CG011552, isoform A [Clunio marinus]
MKNGFVISILVILKFSFSISDANVLSFDKIRVTQESKEKKLHINGFEATTSYWRTQAQNKLKSQLKHKVNENVAKNVIIFLGDGMSLSTVTAARIYFGQKQGLSGEESLLSFEKFPYIGLSKTYCYDKQTADSACSATAYLTGVKANYATIGVNPKVQLNDCESSRNKLNQLSSIMNWAQNARKATGIVTNTRITHASPAGTYARTANRDWESDADMKAFPDARKCSDIAKQLIREEPGNLFNVIYGGGRKKILSEKIIDEEGQRGQRIDGLDLIDEWLTNKNSPKAYYIHNSEGMNQMNHSNVEHVLGLFESDHMKFHLDAGSDQPSLKEMTASAINVLKKHENGFVLFVEGGRIDHAHHQNFAKHALEETVEFSEAIQTGIEMTSEEDTLIVVTSDHAHTMTMSGYSKRGQDILGLNSEISDVDNLPYMTLSYANGPSGVKKRYKIKKDEMKFNDYRYPSLVPLNSETHGGDDVPIYARGPHSHLFTGVLEQNTIPHFIAYAACIGGGLTVCDTRL